MSRKGLVVGTVSILIVVFVYWGTSSGAKDCGTQAAVQRYAIAQVHLGVLYEEGRGVPQDYIQARQWYTQAAVQGYAIAQVHLGVLYAEGRGVPQNFVQAHKWYNLAAANGEKVGGERRDALAKQMTPAQIFKAQRLVREWNSKMP